MTLHPRRWHSTILSLDFSTPLDYDCDRVLIKVLGYRKIPNYVLVFRISVIFPVHFSLSRLDNSVKWIENDKH